jgi:hypothetical protein
MSQPGISNNKCDLGQGRDDPQPAKTAKRDAPQVAEQCWTLGMPKGRRGVMSVPAVLLEHGTSRRTRLRQSLLPYRSAQSSWSPPAAATTCRRSNLLDFKTWAVKARPRERCSTIRTRISTRSNGCGVSGAAEDEIYTQATMTKMAVKHPRRRDGQGAAGRIQLGGSCASDRGRSGS